MTPQIKNDRAPPYAARHKLLFSLVSWAPLRLSHAALSVSWVYYNFVVSLPPTERFICRSSCASLSHLVSSVCFSLNSCLRLLTSTRRRKAFCHFVTPSCVSKKLCNPPGYALILITMCNDCKWVSMEWSSSSHFLLLYFCVVWFVVIFALRSKNVLVAKLSRTPRWDHLYKKKWRSTATLPLRSGCAFVLYGKKPNIKIIY